VFNSLVLGPLIVLFFKCMSALLNLANHNKEGIRWGLVSYTVVMFSVVTVVNATSLSFEFVTDIDNREFPGGQYGSSSLPPGPIGYSLLIGPTALGIVPNVASLSNYWLADALLVSSSFEFAPTPSDV